MNIEPREMLGVLIQIAYTTECLARFGIVHNDLHTGNIHIVTLSNPQVYKYLLSDKNYICEQKKIIANRNRLKPIIPVFILHPGGC